MEDWAKRLDSFLEFDDRKILQDADKASTKQAKPHAEKEFEKYHIAQDQIFKNDFDKLKQELEPKKQGKNNIYNIDFLSKIKTIYIRRKLL